MTTLRRSVEQTITRLALRQLRERASLAGTPTARTDAPQALALLLDYTPADEPLAACRWALIHHVGCVVVPFESLVACAEVLEGSKIHLGVIVRSVDEVQAVLDAGAHEVELIATLDQNNVGIVPEMVIQSAHLCHNAGATFKFDISALALPAQHLCRLAMAADEANVDLITVPAAHLSLIRPSLHRDACLKVPTVLGLETARELLEAGAIRLGTPNAPQLLEAAGLP